MSDTPAAHKPLRGKGKNATTKAYADDMPLLDKTTFQFVTFSDPSGMRDDRAISQIRRHAMKEIGKSRRLPRPAKAKRRTKWQMLHPSGEEDPIDAEDQPQLTWQRIGCSGIDPFCQFPVTLTETSRVLVMSLFGEYQRAFRREWFSNSLGDASTFNSLLSCAALSFAGSKDPNRPFRENLTALHYHQLAVQSAHEQLSKGEEGITDGLIATVLTLYQFTEYLDDAQQWRMQRKGLLALVQKRGIQSLSRNLPLRNSMSWVDLRSAYTRDIVPDIPIPDAWLDATEHILGADQRPTHREVYRTGAKAHDAFAEAIFNSYRRLRTAMSEVRRHVGTSDPLDVDIPLFVMIMVHELLSCQLPIESLKTAPPTVLALEAWRLGMLLFMAPVYRFYGVHPIYMDKLIRKAHRLRPVWSMWDHWDPQSRTLLTWSLFMVAFEAEECEAVEVRKWCADVSARIAKDFIGPSDGSGLLITAKSVLWVPEILDAKAEAFVRKIDERSDVGSTGH